MRWLEVTEKWSQKYKRSINCSNPKGFSQRAHCAGRKKNEGAEITMWTNPEYQGADVDDKYYKKQPVKIVDVSKLTPFEPADKMDPKDNHDNMMRFVDKIKAGKKIKPIVIVSHKGKWLIVDGHHRYFAHLKAGADKIRAVIADPKDLTWRNDVPESVEENFADGKKKGKIYNESTDLDSLRKFVRSQREAPDQVLYQMMLAPDTYGHSASNFVRSWYEKTKEENGLNDVDSALEIMVDKLGLNENFADGKKKGKSRPGRVKRAGASCNGSVTALRKRAKNSSGEKARMYHWCANMKSGRKKK